MKKNKQQSSTLQRFPCHTAERQNLSRNRQAAMDVLDAPANKPTFCGISTCRLFLPLKIIHAVVVNSFEICWLIFFGRVEKKGFTCARLFGFVVLSLRQLQSIKIWKNEIKCHSGCIVLGPAAVKNPVFNSKYSVWTIQCALWSDWGCIFNHV